MQLIKETARFACGFWRDGSLMITEGVGIGKLIQFQKLKRKCGDNCQRRR